MWGGQIMSNIFIRKHTEDEVSLIHIGKMENTNLTVAIYEKQIDRTVWVIPLNEFNDHYEKHEFTGVDHFSHD